MRSNIRNASWKKWQILVKNFQRERWQTRKAEGNMSNTGEGKDYRMHPAKTTRARGRDDGH
eukprot:GSA25T00021369001.1